MQLNSTHWLQTRPLISWLEHQYALLTEHTAILLTADSAKDLPSTCPAALQSCKIVIPEHEMRTAPADWVEVISDAQWVELITHTQHWIW
ncbi:MAG: hypothetical protein VYD08_09750 [Pseudomonadota bacterium]|nr:hypothetical protein [Pseudomonadota bacterium]